MVADAVGGGGGKGLWTAAARATKASREVRRGGRRWDDHQHQAQLRVVTAPRQNPFSESCWKSPHPRNFAVLAKQEKERARETHSEPSTLYNCAFPEHTHHHALLGVAPTTSAPTHCRRQAVSHTGNADAGSVGPAQQRVLEREGQRLELCVVGLVFVFDHSNQ